MPFPLGISDSQKKQPPLPPSVVSQSDSGSGREFDNGANFLTFQDTTFTGKLPIIDYTVTASDTGSSEVFTQTINSTAPFVFTGLKSARNYTFRIRARNAVFNSANSSAFGPGIATLLSLSSRPNSALQICAVLMFIGGISVAFTKISREWIPEKKEIDTLPIWRVPAMQILALEGVVIGLGFGAFNIGIPAFTTQENLPSRAALLFAVFGLFNVFGGVIAGTISRKLSPLKGFLITYKFWVISVAPLSLAYPDWSLILLAALIGLVGGVQKVFYWEVTEAVRPKGTAVSALAWLWTVEGTFAAIGSAIGGFIAENYGPRWCFAMTSVSVFIGYLILAAGKKHFVRANELPSDESDLNAMEDNADKNR